MWNQERKRSARPLGAARPNPKLTIHRHNKRNRLSTERFKNILVESSGEGTPNDTN
jgi:hypothetical protein